MRNFILLFALLLSAQLLSAQVTIRPQAGFNFSSITEDLPQETLDGNSGYQFGVDVKFGDRLYFQPGLFYESRKGDVIPDDEAVGDIDLKVDRIRIPAIVGYNLLRERDQFFNVRVFTGPSLSFAVSKDLDDQGLLSVEEDDLQTFAFGWGAGAGVDIAFLFVDVGYEFGLSKLVDHPEAKPRNNLFFLNGGINLKF